ncbi:MAG: PIG-L family deacetylase, partial [Myxococcales bacterium]|nr:PIG-L family deacetylase [Myxococcales bacterium]
MSSARRILVVAPHADDETLGVGGTIARRAAEGCEVHV